MRRTGYDQIGHKFMGGKCNLADKTYFKGSKINTYLIEYFTKTLVKKEVKLIQTCWSCC